MFATGTGSSKPPTLSERELLLEPFDPPSSGFTPRHVQKLAVNRKPHTMLDIECSHYMRCPSQECVHGHPSIEYRLWLEAGKYDGPFPTKPDPNYNSNVWRNFRKQYGFDLKTDGKNVTEVIAAMYPLNVPPPSRVGENTFNKYIAETKLFKNERFKAMAIQRTSNDIEEFRRLRVKSRARNPPLDEQGNILPPENFKKYPARFIPPSPSPVEATESEENVRVDMFGQRTAPAVRVEPHLWKLTAKLKYPEYEKVKQEVEKRRVLQDQKIMKIIKGPVPGIQKVV